MTGQHGLGLVDELLAHIAAFHDGLPQGYGETGDGGSAGKALCQWVYDNADGLAARITALEAEKADLVEAAEALKQDLLDRAEWDRSEAVKIVAAGNGAWFRFCAALAKARQS